MGADKKPWYLMLFTEEWLQNRVIFFRNTSVVMKNGVPQGGGYSPIDFLVYLAYECADIDVMVFFSAFISIVHPKSKSVLIILTHF